VTPRPGAAVIVVMGPAGAGKTTVGRALADALGRHFYDADDFHDPANVARMRRGEALTDADRAPWLAALSGVIAREIGDVSRGGPGAVLACSALRRAYREALMPRSAPPGAVRFVYLRAGPGTLEARLSTRRGHFAPPALLASQLATLEEPDTSEHALVVDAEQSVDRVVAEVRRRLA
jgi:gluconokinase